MREQIDKIKEAFDIRMYQHQKFKSLIKYKDNLVTADPVRNEEFEKALGATFYERQKNAFNKII